MADSIREGDTVMDGVGRLGVVMCGAPREAMYPRGQSVLVRWSPHGEGRITEVRRDELRLVSRGRVTRSGSDG